MPSSNTAIGLTNKNNFIGICFIRFYLLAVEKDGQYFYTTQSISNVDWGSLSAHQVSDTWWATLSFIQTTSRISRLNSQRTKRQQKQNGIRHGLLNNVSDSERKGKIKVYRGDLQTGLLYLYAVGMTGLFISTSHSIGNSLCVLKILQMVILKQSRLINTILVMCLFKSQYRNKRI